MADGASVQSYIDIKSDTLSDDEKEIIIQHLILSNNIKHLWKHGDAIIEGIFNRKRKKKRILYEKALRRTVRCIRRLAKYEVLRSCLEGLLFDQLVHEDDDMFTITFDENIVDNMSLTHVYFSTNTWDQTKYKKEVEFDSCDEVTQDDCNKLQDYVYELEVLISIVQNYVRKLLIGRWRHRVMRALMLLKKNHKLMNSILNNTHA